MFVTRLPKKSLTAIVTTCCCCCCDRRPHLPNSRLFPSVPGFEGRHRFILRAISLQSFYSTTRLAWSLKSFRESEKRALQVVDGLAGADTVQTVAYSDDCRLNNLQTDRSALRSLVQNLRPSHRKTNHLVALKLAQQLLASAPNDRREIDWISDFQQTGWVESAEGRR
jgi:hypothetical protein